MHYHTILLALEWFFWGLWVLAVLLVISWGLSILFGAPYLPTLKHQRRQALDLLDLKPGQLFVDLGSGDGTMLSLAAARGLNAVGYEINPFLAFFSWLRTRRYGRRVKVKLTNFWYADLSDADGIFVFLITHRMKHLDKLLSSQARGKLIKVASNSFKIPGKKPVAKLGPIFLYHYGQLARRR